MTGILNIQMNPIIGDKKANLKRIEKYIKDNSDRTLDLVIMPEFFSTGISDKDFKKYPESEDGGETIKYISELAKKYYTNIVAGTVIEKSDDKLYNTSFVISRNGEIVAKYRKRHLYNYMGGSEGELITPGDKIVTANLDFAKIGLCICFDIRYPQQFKELAKSGAEIIVLPTAWVVPNEIYEDKKLLKNAQEMWIAMHRTRAYDNLVYIISSNQTGKCNNKVSCIGNSIITAPTSEVVFNAGNKQGGFFTDIDLNVVKYYKSIYPIAKID